MYKCVDMVKFVSKTGAQVKFEVNLKEKFQFKCTLRKVKDNCFREISVMCFCKLEL